MSKTQGNPFTSFLKKGRRHAVLHRFITLWDEAERLLIETYRAGCPPDGAGVRWQQLRQKLPPAYRRVSGLLEPFWRQATVNHAPVPEDPFLAVIRIESPDAIVGNWDLLQMLPPAREAVNRALIR